MDAGEGVEAQRQERRRQRGHRRWNRCVRALLVLCMAVATFAGGAQTPPTALHEYARDAWTTRNGLPHNTLRDIAQTPEGHLWFATWEGVVRYNGLDFTVFSRGTAPALPDSGIGTLYVDVDGTLWLGDSRGNVSSIDARGNWAHWNPAEARAPRVMIEALQKDHRGRLWMLYENVGVGRLDPDGSFHHYPPPVGMRSIANHTHMAVDDQDRVWIGTHDGLMVIGADDRLVPAQLGLPDGVAWPYRAPDGAVWVATRERIYRLEGDQLRLQHHLPGVGAFTEMLQDSHGELWLGTENNGLWRVGRGGVEHLASDDGLPDYRVISLHEDTEGSIWVGMNGGLMRLRQTLFSSLTHAQGLSGDFVRSLLEDETGALWIGSSSGLDRMDERGRISPVPLVPGERQPSVMSLARGVADDMWVGTRGDGVFHVQAGGRVRRFGQPDGLPRGNFRAVLVDGRQRTWLGSAQGVLQLVDGRAQPLPHDNAPEAVVLALAWLDDVLWIGTAEGAWRLLDDRIEKLPVAQSNGARAVYGFRQLGDAVWMTTDRGLLRYRDGRLATVGLEHGLPVDTFFELIPDTHGNVWISSNRGVWRTRVDRLEAVANGLATRADGEMYREIDGMVSAQANGSSGPAGVLRRDGSVWVATAGGVVTVRPETLQRLLERTPPPTVLEGVFLDGEGLAWRNQEKIAIPGGKRLSLQYVGLSYLMSDRIRYRTRLHGLDADWIERGNQRAVEYIGLPPGDYALHVAAAHPDGRWSEGQVLWQFTVLPLWWQRTDVRVLAGLLCLALMITGYRYLTDRYRRNNQRLSELVAERTRDLQRQAEHLLQANREKTRLAERLREQADEFGRQAREDVLTGLPNRRAFDEVLARELARSARGGHPLALVVLDLDYFKAINDAHSHGVGDLVLREVAQLLRASCRESDLPARLGGEEFALVLYDTHLDGALGLCERLRQHFHARRNWGGIDGMCVTFSAGVVEYAGDESPLRLYQRADRALYRAKAEGRDRSCADRVTA